MSSSKTSKLFLDSSFSPSWDIEFPNFQPPLNCHLKCIDCGSRNTKWAFFDAYVSSLKPPQIVLPQSWNAKIGHLGTSDEAIEILDITNMALHFTPASQCFIHEFNFIKFIDDTGENEEKQQVQYQLLLIKKQNYLHFLEIHEWLVKNRFQILNWFHNICTVTLQRQMASMKRSKWRVPVKLLIR